MLSRGPLASRRERGRDDPLGPRLRASRGRRRSGPRPGRRARPSPAIASRSSCTSPARRPAARKRVRIDGVGRRPGRDGARAAHGPLRARGHDAHQRRSRRSGAGFLDALVAQREPTAAATMSTYARALTQRNSLLRRHPRGRRLPRRARATGTRCSCDSGGQLLEWRRETLAGLAAPLAAAHARSRPASRRSRLRYLTNAAPRRGRGRPRGAAAPPPRDRREGDLERRHARRARIATTSSSRATVVTSPPSRRAASSAAPSSRSSSPSSTSSRRSTAARRCSSSTTSSASSTPIGASHLVRRIDALPQAIVTTTTARRPRPRARRAARASGRSSPGAVRSVRPRAGRHVVERSLAADATDERPPAPALPARRGPPARRGLPARPRGGAPRGPRSGRPGSGSSRSRCPVRPARRASWRSARRS